MADCLTEISRNHRIRLFPVTETIRSPFRGRVVFGSFFGWGSNEQSDREDLGQFTANSAETGCVERSRIRVHYLAAVRTHGERINGRSALASSLTIKAADAAAE